MYIYIYIYIYICMYICVYIYMFFVFLSGGGDMIFFISICLHYTIKNKNKKTRLLPSTKIYKGCLGST